MALPKHMRLKGHRTFNYIHKNSIKYYGKLMTFKVARSNPKILLSHKLYDNASNFRVSIAISKKVAKKAVERNKMRRFFQEWLSRNLKINNNHKPYWLIVNLKRGVTFNDKSILLEEFQKLMNESGLIT